MFVAENALLSLPVGAKLVLRSQVKVLREWLAMREGQQRKARRLPEHAGHRASPCDIYISPFQGLHIVLRQTRTCSE